MENGMVEPKNQLERILIETVLANGVQRQGKITEIREYLRQVSTEQLRKEIGQLTSIETLRFLQAAGVPAGAQDVFLAQYDRLSQR